MSTLRQPCPSCGRTLELPTTAIGRLAKCPACESTFEVLDPSAPTANTPGADVGQAADSGRPEPNSDVERRPSMSPLGATNSSDASFRSAPPVSHSDPYSPTYSPSPVVTIDNLQIVERPVEDIVSPAWSIFVERWAPLLLAILIVGGIGFLGIMVPVIALMIAASNGLDLAAVAIAIVLVPVMIVASTYAWVGLTRVSLAVARNQPTPLSELLAPMNLVWRMLLASLVLMMVIGGGVLLVGGVLGGVAFAVGGQEAAMAIQALLMLLSMLGSFLVQIVLWPMPFVISDDKSTAIGAIRVSYAIAMQNKLTSFLLILIKMVLSMVGGSLCYVGLLATQPLTMLLFAVAYLLMTNQAIANPRAFQVQPTYPEPSRDH